MSFGLRSSPTASISLPVQKIGEDAGAAAEIGYPRARLEPGEPHAGGHQPNVAFGREDIIGVHGGVSVEERDLLLLVLRKQRHPEIPWSIRRWLNQTMLYLIV